MSRNKYILYAAPLLVVVLVVAFTNQIRKLQTQLRSSVRIIPAESKTRGDTNQNEIDQDAARLSRRPEVLVKFRAGVSEDVINQITSRFGDHIRDEIEAVPGLIAIDDSEDMEATVVIGQYKALPEVEYAEPNYEISLDSDGEESSGLRMNEPSLEEQWALGNDGRNDGKRGADISAMRAWTTTSGSRDIVVAVLDSGVEYTHVDLVNNIWTRPANIEPYHDRDLGTIDDVHGLNLVENSGEPTDENGKKLRRSHRRGVWKQAGYLRR
jgi:subtilisin family serine protease